MTLRREFSKLRALFRRSKPADDLAEEIRSHLEIEEQENLESGMTPDEAHYAALRRFGNVTLAQERSREMWGWNSVETLWQDLRFGFRMILKNRGFTAVAVLTLALGIGANTAIFSIVDSMFLRPLPVSNPDEMVTLGTRSPQGPGESISYPDYESLRQQASSFSGIAVWSRQSRFVNSMDESSQVLVDEVSPDYFSVLGVKAVLGRTFQPDIDGASQLEQEVVVSYRMWKGRLGGDPGIIGKTIKLTGKTATVLGITPPHFQGMSRFVPTDIWIPAPDSYAKTRPQNRDARYYEAAARLCGGTAIDQARVELRTLSHLWEQEYPASNRAVYFDFQSERERVRESLKLSFFLMAVVALVLLVSCGNVAGLLLARAESRRREVALRVALGAGKKRLFRQFLVEGFLLSSAGGAAGLLLTRWLSGLEDRLMPPSPFTMGPDLRIDARVLLFTLAVCLAATFIFTLAPALQAWKTDLNTTLKNDEASLQGRGYRLSFRGILVSGQIAISVVLLTGSVLLYRSLWHSMHLSAGFELHKSFVVVNLFTTGPTAAPGRRLLPLLAEKVRGLPGISQVTYARRILLSGSGGGTETKVSIPGVELPQGQPSIPVKFNAVGPNYFQAVGTRILRGRGFNAGDNRENSNVVVINDTMARRFWPAGDAVGRSLKIESKDTLIVGVAEDAKIIHIHEPPEPYMYLSFGQHPSDEGALIVETMKDPRLIVPTVRQAVHAAEPHTAIWEIQTSQDLLHYALWDEMVEAQLIGGLSMLGAFLAAVGLYGVVAYLVNRRTREIGIRIALGATRDQAVGMVLAQGLKFVGAGVIVGLTVAVAVTRLLAGYLYGVESYDLASLAAGVFMATAITLLACYIPARRAAKVNPMVALRYE
ncbi:MAG: ADOP family duplicated permease [Terriglobia bacterium]